MLCRQIDALKRPREETWFSKWKFALYTLDLLFSVVEIFVEIFVEIVEIFSFFSILVYMIHSISFIMRGVQKKT